MIRAEAVPQDALGRTGLQVSDWVGRGAIDHIAGDTAIAHERWCWALGKLGHAPNLRGQGADDPDHGRADTLR